MDKVVVNIIILHMLNYFSYSQNIFHCFKLFHPTLFKDIYDYFQIFVIFSYFSYFTLGYFQLF
jgi:hypothetical protein